MFDLTASFDLTQATLGGIGVKEMKLKFKKTGASMHLGCTFQLQVQHHMR